MSPARSYLLIAAFIFVVAAAHAASLERVDTLIREGQYGEAWEGLEDCSEAPPGSETLAYRRALILYHENREGDASKILSVLQRVNPTEPSYHNLAAAMYHGQDKHDSAIKHLCLSILSEPNSPEVWICVNDTMRRSMYNSPSARAFLGKFPIEYPDSLGARLILAEFAFFGEDSAPFRKLITETMDQSLPDIFIQRFARFSRETADSELDLDISLWRQRLRPENSAVSQHIQRLQDAIQKSHTLSTYSARGVPLPPKPVSAHDMPELPEGVMPDEAEDGGAPVLYRLPFRRASINFCAQGADGEESHSLRARFACDFLAKPGTPVLAARDGVVHSLRSLKPAKGKTDYQVYIAIKHDDGTIARYYHLKEESAKVEVGARVERGQQLAVTGRTAITQYPVLHFEVVGRAPLDLMQPESYRRWKTRPIMFEELVDMREEQGAPMAGRWYVSANTIYNH